ncbi:beta strand repeat-containing protein [Maribacter sp. ACAM166]|uniref:beta strand repeat-containing protein n=1 Tax=Maribacter sp. ACAM166 TaxID=2508996 RepID=UPI0010FCF34A|nr:hypothetical protein [Maribacter sp. ACAM166]TLP80976.1 hypothetical protein ES765_05895 [Maribacter sp. ACAM166]
MKAVIFFALFIMLTIPTVFGQIKIGDNPQNIDPSSVLELESRSKVLVITRITTTEMDAITPQRGGMVYNTDTACIHYFDGTQWINLCDAVSFTITNDPIVNNRSTIEITQSEDGYNLEIAKNSILGDNIVDGGIGPDDIQDNSIGQDKLAAESVGSSEIRQNAVGSDEIRDGSIVPTDLANFIPGQFLTTDENGIVQWEDANDLYDLTFSKLDTTLTITRSTIQGSSVVNLGALIGSDDQQLTLIDNSLTLENGGNSIDLSTYLNTDSQNLGTATLTDEELTISIENGDPTTADLSAFATDIGLTTGLNLKEDVANKDSNPNLGMSEDAYPTQNAVKTYVDAQVGGVTTDDDITDANLNTLTSLLTIEEGATSIDVSLADLEESQAILDETQRATNAENANATAITGLQATKEFIANKNPNVNLGSSNTDYPTQNAVKVYVDTELSLVAAGSGTTELADQATITGDGSIGNEFTLTDEGITPIKIQPSLTTGQFLSTDAGGNVVWVNVPASGTTELADQATITGNGSIGNEFTVTDAGITPIKIQPSLTTGQFLGTDAGGNVVWANVPASGTTELADQATITGNGSIGNEFKVTDAGITPIKIQPSLTTGQFLGTDAGGNVVWANVPASGTTELADQATITGNGSIGNEFTVVAIGTAQIINNEILLVDLNQNGATDGQILKWDATENAGAGGWIVSDDRTDGTGIPTLANATILIGDDFNIPQERIVSGDASMDNNGVLAISADAITSNKIVDGTIGNLDLADNSVGVNKIAEGLDGQILTTNGTDVVWATSSNIVSTDTPNAITIGTDSGALYDDTPLTNNITVNTNGIATNATALGNKEDAANKSNDAALADNSTTDFPTEQAVKTYVDTQIGTITAPIIVSGNSPNSITVGTDGGALYDETPLTNNIIANTTGITANATALGNKEDTANKSNDAALTDNSTIDFPTEQAVKTYVDTQIGIITAPIIVSGNSPNSITVGTDGGALYDDTLLTNNITANTNGITANATALGNKEDAANKSNDAALADNSTTDFPTEQAVKTYVDTQIGTITAPIIVSGNSPNSITVGTDGGALYDDTPLTNNITTNTNGITANATALGNKEDAANKSNDGTLVDNSIDDFPTEQAVKTYVDGQISGLNVGDNFSNSNLPLTANRVHQLAGFDLSFDGSGSVGIGNNNPQNKLHVSGEIRSEGYNSSKGTEDFPAYSFSTGDDSDTGMWRDQADELAFSAGGQEVFRIEENGGILDAIVSGRLEINSSLMDVNNIPGAAGQILSSTVAGVQWIDAAISGTTYTEGTGIIISAANAIGVTDLGIDTQQLASDAVTSAKIKNETILNEDIQNNTINPNKLNPSGNENEVLTISGSTVVWAAVTPAGNSDITSSTLQVTGGANSVLSNVTIDIATGAIGQGEISDNAIGTNEIIDGTVLNADIGAGITGAKILPDFGGQAITTSGNLNITGTGTVTVQGALVHPDYVFQKYFLGNSILNPKYEFSNLSEIEEFVKQNNHLPGIKSAKEIKEQGFLDLGEASRINLEKIEELFLHTIEQEKKIKALESVNKNMASEVEVLKAQMKEIKNLLLEKSND